MLYHDDDEITAADLNGIVGATVRRFASTAERDSSDVPTVAGMYCDVAGQGLYRYSGTAWVMVLPVPGANGTTLKISGGQAVWSV